MKNEPVIFENIRIVDPEGPNDGQRISLLIDRGIISLSPKETPETVKRIQAQGWSVSPGIFDFQSTCGEPGFEEKETIATLAEAALAGGVTALQLMPSLEPVTDHRGAVEYLQQLSGRTAVQIIPAGALSVNLEGKDMAELANMYQGGARAFTDDKHAVKNPVLLHLALQYSRVSGGLIMTHAEETAMSLGGKMHEGLMSVQLGMKGAPALAEEIGLRRNLALAEYHNAPIHISGVSSKASVEILKEARAKGIRVSASVYAHQLFFCDDDLAGFDSNLKVWPPLRGASDRAALVEGVRQGIIEVICSDHRPETIETKAVEFGFASNGISGIETLFGAARKALPTQEDLPLLIQALCIAPRKLLGLSVPHVESGKRAELFFYTDQEEFTFDLKTMRSKSKNTPFSGKTLMGVVKGVATPSGWSCTED